MGTAWNWQEMAAKNQIVSVAFDDMGHVQTKTGPVIGANETHLFIRSQGVEQGILIARILRIELRNGEARI